MPSSEYMFLNKEKEDPAIEIPYEDVTPIKIFVSVMTSWSQNKNKVHFIPNKLIKG